MQSIRISPSPSAQEPAALSFTSRTSHAFAGYLAAPGTQVKPSVVPGRRKLPLLVRANRALRAVLITMCGIAILGYGLDVATSNDVSKLQDQARRLSEQNTELSAQLLRVISFQGIQDSALGRFGLRVPEQVLIVKEVPAGPMAAFKPEKHHLPLVAGY